MSAIETNKKPPRPFSWRKVRHAGVVAGIAVVEAVSPSGKHDVAHAQQETKEPTITVATEHAGNIAVRDFRADPRTVQNENIPGEYILVGGKIATPKTTPYVIAYVESTQMFNIALLREPIGSMRNEAEKELMERLGVSKSQMCLLKYTVSAPSWVNATYAGVDLRFSFCPGAVKLPR